jgi:hypothetical protein
MLPAGYDPAIPASERPQTHVLDRSATGIGQIMECYTTDGDVSWKFLDCLCDCGFLKDFTPYSHLTTGRWIQISSSKQNRNMPQDMARVTIRHSTMQLLFPTLTAPQLVKTLPLF